MENIENKYLQWMEEYFQDENGKEAKNILIKASEEGKLLLFWSCSLYGRFGMSIRNYMRLNHPEIDNEWPNYGNFEDYTWQLIQKLINKWTS